MLVSYVTGQRTVPGMVWDLPLQNSCIGTGLKAKTLPPFFMNWQLDLFIKVFTYSCLKKMVCFVQADLKFVS